MKRPHPEDQGEQCNMHRSLVEVLQEAQSLKNMNKPENDASFVKTMASHLKLNVPAAKIMS